MTEKSPRDSNALRRITPYIVLWLPNVLCAAFAIWQHQKAKFRG